MITPQLQRSAELSYTPPSTCELRAGRSGDGEEEKEMAARPVEMARGGTMESAKPKETKKVLDVVGSHVVH